MLGCRAQQGALVPGDIYGAIRKRKKLSKGTGYGLGPSRLGCCACTFGGGSVHTYTPHRHAHTACIAQ